MICRLVGGLTIGVTLGPGLGVAQGVIVGRWAGGGMGVMVGLVIRVEWFLAVRGDIAGELACDCNGLRSDTIIPANRTQMKILTTQIPVIKLVSLSFFMQACFSGVLGWYWRPMKVHF